MALDLTNDTIDDPPDDHEARQKLKRVAVRVIVVQIVALIALWLLQARFGGA